MEVYVADVVTTGGTQSRVSLSEETVSTYADLLKEGTAMSPIIVFHDGSTYWLADGFHRLMAHIRNGAECVTADVRQGTRREAVLHSVGANHDHGLPRTNADKRHAVLLLLKDEEWAVWSNCEIARVCVVNESTVRRIRDESSSVLPKMPAERKVARNGTTYVQNTENIGRKQSDPVQAETTRFEQPKSRGIGLGYAHKAISFLQQIPLNDGLRDEAMDTVAQWINDNR